MGWLFKRDRSKYWYARWQVNGQEHIVSTHRTNRAEAKVVLARLEAGSSELDMILHDLNRYLDQLPEEERDGKIESITEALRGRRTTKLEISVGWEAWEKNPNKKRVPKSKTLAGYKAIWSRFKTWTEQHGVAFFHDVTRVKARDYAEYLWASTVTPRTYNAHIKQPQAMFTLLEEQAELKEKAWRFIARKDELPEGRRNLTKEELQKVFEKAEGPWKVMLAGGMYTGLRLGDVACLRWEDLTLKPEFTVVIPMKTSRKERSSRWQFIPHWPKFSNGIGRFRKMKLQNMFFRISA